ncbi:MAG: hypothetical protein RL264_3072 [Bacteroidota bacterium]
MKPISNRMRQLTFKIQIETTPEKLWNCLWEAENYKKWTNVFCAGSHYKTDSFSEGSKIHLLTPDGLGMYSIIEKLEPNKTLVFRHLGELKNFEEQPAEKNEASWKDARESYEILPNQSGVELTVKVDCIEQYCDYMNATFPKALEVLLQLSSE